MVESMLKRLLFLASIWMTFDWIVTYKMHETFQRQERTSHTYYRPLNVRYAGIFSSADTDATTYKPTVHKEHAHEHLKQLSTTYHKRKIL